MVDYAISWGLNTRAQELFQSGGSAETDFYYAQMHRPECTFASATRVRCPLYMWWEARATPSTSRQR